MVFIRDVVIEDKTVRHALYEKAECAHATRSMAISNENGSADQSAQPFLSIRLATI